jgi:hypothetical protein
MSATFRFKGRATGSDPTGYYYERWDRAMPISVLAETKTEASQKAFAMLGVHGRFGSYGGKAGSGWAVIWDSMDEEPQTTPERKESQ